MKTSFKEVFRSEDWRIIEIRGSMKTHRINAKRRFPIPDKSNFFSEWGNTEYLEKLARLHYGKKLEDFKCYK